MSLTTIPTTLLEAVNVCLKAIGIVPVNSLETAGLTDAAIAKDTLEQTAREVQSNGWWFNTTSASTLTPSGGQIAVPTNASRIAPAQATSVAGGETVQFVAREGKLWNLMTNTYTFGGPVKADIVWLFEFEQLPQSVRWYVTVRAARLFQTQVLGDESLGVFTSVNEAEAFAALEQDHLLSAPSTVFRDRVAQRFRSVRQPPIGYQPKNTGNPQQ